MIVPGRILIVDDAPTAKEKAKVDKLIQSLRETGESVLFSPSFPQSELCFENVRLLIIDLLLIPQDKDRSLEMLATIIHRLTKKTPFFVIAIWSKATRDKRGNIIGDVKQAFTERTQTELKAKILEPFGKKITPAQLMKRIKKEMASLPECALLFEIESSIENARDRTLSDIVSTAEIPLIAESIKQEEGGIALSREMTNLFLKILSRHSAPTKNLQKCLNTLTQYSTNIDSSKYGYIHNLQSYYPVKAEERTWTGDILLNRKKKNWYEVVVSPACDFAQKKIDYMKTIFGIRIDNDDLMKSDQLTKLAKQLSFKSGPTALQKGVLTCRISERYYSLTYLKDATNRLYHLILDFQAVGTLRFRKDGVSLEKMGFNRLCRIDTPLIHDLLQAYSAYSSRIGTASTPSSVVASAKSKIR